MIRGENCTISMKREMERTEGKSCGGERIGEKEGEVNILRKREGPKKGKTDREEEKGGIKKREKI